VAKRIFNLLLHSYQIQSTSISHKLRDFNGLSKLNHHSILPESHLSSNHTPLSIDIPIYKEVICTSKLLIPPKSEQETAFIEEIISNFKNLTHLTLETWKNWNA